MNSSNEKVFVLAIDGPAGAGKSTVSRLVAEELGLGYVDSGAIYRASALAAITRGTALDDAPAVAGVLAGTAIELSADSRSVKVDGEDVSARIRTPEVSQAASKISAHPEVRAALIDLQRAAAKAPGIVADGRDIGTVIFPAADLKVFLDADPGERASRRTRELRQAGKEVDESEVRREMEERDLRDRTRETAPLRPAEDAIIVDSTSSTIDEVVIKIVMEARSRGAV